MEDVLIKCPECGHEFNVQDALAGDVEKRLQEQYQQKLQEELARFKSKETELLTREKEFEEKKRQENELFQQRLQKELAQRQELIKQQFQKENEEKYSLILSEKAEAEKRIREFEASKLEFELQKQQMSRMKEQMELDMQKALLAKEDEIRAEARKLADARAAALVEEEIRKQKFEREQREMELENRLKRMMAEEREEALRKAEYQRQMEVAELNKKLSDQQKLVDEMQRKANQGSMQTQGEVAELMLEDLLRNSFPDDKVREVGKGISGADCVLEVHNSFGQLCGKLVFESKRTKHFTAAWIDKLKADTLQVQGDLSVLVTEVMPAEHQQMGLFDGVWVCRFSEVIPLVAALRHGLLQVQLAKASQENKGDKMNMLYDYLTGNEFRQTVEAIVETFAEMQAQLNKEKRQFTKIWSEREKQIERMMGNTLRMHGSIRGIAGSSIPDINLLDSNTEEEEE